MGVEHWYNLLIGCSMKNKANVWRTTCKGEHHRHFISTTFHSSDIMIPRNVKGWATLSEKQRTDFCKEWSLVHKLQSCSNIDGSSCDSELAKR